MDNNIPISWFRTLLFTTVASKAHQNWITLSKQVITKAHYAFKRGLNIGKTIRSSKSCIILFAHFCPIARQEIVLDNHSLKHLKYVTSNGADEQTGVSNDVILHLNAKKYVTPKLMRSFHIRQTYDYYGKRALFLNRENLCNISDYDFYDWIDPISDKLDSIVKKIYRKKAVDFSLQ